MCVGWGGVGWVGGTVLKCSTMAYSSRKKKRISIAMLPSGRG